MAVKRRVAVLFEGRAPEHDVSIVSGLQALGAIDTGAYEAFPVYLSMQGNGLSATLYRTVRTTSRTMKSAAA